MSKKKVWLFEDGKASMCELLGAKGANLAEMFNIGLPVPNGFVISTEICKDYINSGELVDEIISDIKDNLRKLEKNTGKKLGDKKNPLLISIRSGASVSMPGMMDTVLNLGICEDALEGISEIYGDEKFAYDCYKRFLESFGSIVLGISKDKFEEIANRYDTSSFNKENMRNLIRNYKNLLNIETKGKFTEDPIEQMILAVKAIFDSWNSERAVTYRKYAGISDELGTAVTIQQMVFGNLNDSSVTGVVFSRNPSTGAKELYGEYITCAQGEDVVSGSFTPKKISDLAKEMPSTYSELLLFVSKLEKHYKAPQDIEFTVENGKLYLLQTRKAKVSAKASIRIAVDMFEEKILSKDEALMLVDPYQIYQVLLPTFDEDEKKNVELITSGLAAAPGAASGKLVFSPDEAASRGGNGEKIILARPETCPDDIHGMIAAKGVITLRGGMTSHAAVVAKGIGKACVTGCENITINEVDQTIVTNSGKIIHKDSVISIDGSTGEVFLGKIKTKDPELDSYFEKFFKIVDDQTKLFVMANADTPEDVKVALRLGAKGVGLCRTEHMFMEVSRLPWVKKMILAKDKAERIEALNHIFPMQYQDFYAMFKALGARHMTIRLLDPPLHEFLPSKDEMIEKVAVNHALGKDSKEDEELLADVRKMSETNPMMGLRGCRLGLLYPEINEMQVRAIFSAACDLKLEGIDVKPEIMVPLIGHVNELAAARRVLDKVAKDVMNAKGVTVEYKIGTMIEIPRAALTADQIAEYAEFFSFGTNDLTQMTFGYSRDDAENKFLKVYLEQKILPQNPFKTIDRDGVGQLMKMAIAKALKVRPDLKKGICGEHGGDPASVKFCHEIGLDYVSCSPFRVPQARLAAAQAAVLDRINKN